MIHLNPDHYLQTESGRVFTPERNAAAWEQLYRELDEVLKNGKGRVSLFVVLGVQGAGKSTWIAENSGRLGDGAIFVDAALPGVRHRARILTAAEVSGTPAIAVWINVPLETALARNRQRPQDEQVSEEVIRYVFSNFEPPTIDEGFVEIHSVQSQ